MKNFMDPTSAANEPIQYTRNAVVYKHTEKHNSTVAMNYLNININVIH